MIKLLHITPNFNYSCGRSKLVHLYLKYFSNHPEYEMHFITNSGDSLERLNDLPHVNFQKFDFSTGYKNIFYFRQFYTNLSNYVLKYKIDLIHTHHRFPELIAVRIGNTLNVKTVFSTHGFTYGYQNFSHKSNRIISVSNSITDFLIDNFKIQKEKIQTLYNPVNLFPEINPKIIERFKHEHGVRNSVKIILFVGRLKYDKGYDTLLKSYEILCSRYEDLILIIIGDPDKKSKRIFQKFKSNKLIFIEPQNDINYLYSIADIVVLPSRTDTFPFVMIEAGSFKKPFIGGNTGGIAEFIEDGKNGFLVDPENPQQLTEKIVYLINNPDIGKVLGENLYNKVDRLCDYNNYFNEVEKIYNSLLTSE